MIDESREDPGLLNTMEMEDEAEPSTAEEVILTPPSPIEEVIILLPALDEERGIELVLDRIPLEELQDMGCEVAILVVDGESEDATREIAQSKGAHVFIQSGHGKGNGVRQAFELIVRHQAEARCRHHRQSVVMLDADGTYPVEDVPLIVDALRNGYDVVLGSRFLGRPEPGAMTPLNHLGNRILSLAARILFDTPVTDVCTGMWGFSEEFLQRCDLHAKGFDLEAEVFASAALLRARMTEVPIEYRVRQGEPKLVPIRTGAQIAWCLLRKRFQVFRGRPAPLRERATERPRVCNESMPVDP